MGLLHPLAQALVRLCAVPRRQILVNNILIENVTESVGARICAIGPLGNPRTNEDMILPDQRFDVPFNLDRIVGQAGCNESRRKIVAGNAGDIEQTSFVVGEAVELMADHVQEAVWNAILSKCRLRRQAPSAVHFDDRLLVDEVFEQRGNEQRVPQRPLEYRL